MRYGSKAARDTQSGIADRRSCSPKTAWATWREPLTHVATLGLVVDGMANLDCPASSMPVIEYPHCKKCSSAGHMNVPKSKSGCRPLELRSRDWDGGTGVAMV